MIADYNDDLLCQLTDFSIIIMKDQNLFRFIKIEEVALANRVGGAHGREKLFLMQFSMV